MPNPLHVPRKRRFVFMLTPLVDVMFLLLIFFMLSSQTAPYSLLKILGGAAQAEGSEPVPEAVPPPAPASGRGELIVSIGNGFARFNGERVEIADLRAAIERFSDAGFSSAVLLPARTSTVQDVVSVLESFESTAFGNARLMMTASQ